MSRKTRAEWRKQEAKSGKGKTPEHREDLRAWLSVVAAGLNHMLITMGLSSVGAFYRELLLTFQESQARTAWAASIQLAVGAILGIFICPQVRKYGCCLMTRIGSVLGCIGYVTSSLATSLNQLYLTFGVLVGLGNGFLFFSAAISIQVQFTRHRSLATALATCGVSLAMFVFPPVARGLTTLYGWRGCVLNLGGLYLNGVVTAHLMADRETTARCMTCPPRAASAPNTATATAATANTTTKEQPAPATPRQQQPPATLRLPTDERISLCEDDVLIKSSPNICGEQFFKSTASVLYSEAAPRNASETPSTRDEQSPHAPSEQSCAEGLGQKAADLDECGDGGDRYSKAAAPEMAAAEAVRMRPVAAMGLPAVYICRDHSSMQISPAEEEEEHADTRSSSNSSVQTCASNWQCIAGSQAAMQRNSKVTVVPSAVPMFLSPMTCREGCLEVSLEGCRHVHQRSRDDSGNYTQSLPAIHVTAPANVAEPSVTSPNGIANTKSHVDTSDISPLPLSPSPCAQQPDCSVPVGEMEGARSLSREGLNMLKSSLLTLRDFLLESTDFSLLIEVRFMMFLIGSILNIFGYLVPVLFLPIRATSVLGLSDANAAALISSIGISITCGRLVSGALGDCCLSNLRAAHYGVPIIFVGILNILSTFLMSFQEMMVYAILYGFFTGVYLVAQQPLLVEILSLEQFAKSIGILTLFTGSVTLLCQPFAGFLVDLTGHYELPFIVCGVLQMIGGLLILSTRLSSVVARCFKKEAVEDEDTQEDVCRISQV